MKKTLVVFLGLIGVITLIVIAFDNPDAVPSGKVLTFNIVEEQDLSYAGCKRVSITTQIDAASRNADVEKTLQTILTSYQYENWQDVTIFAYRTSDSQEVISSANNGSGPTLGKKEYSICN